MQPWGLQTDGQPWGLQIGGQPQVCKQVTATLVLLEHLQVWQWKIVKNPGPQDLLADRVSGGGNISLGLAYSLEV